MTVERALKEAGISVEIYDYPLERKEIKVIVDTSKHDEEIRAGVIDEVENGLTKLMILSEENKSLSFSKGHYDLVFTVLADFLDISETRIEEKWKQVKEQK